MIRSACNNDTDDLARLHRSPSCSTGGISMNLPWKLLLEPAVVVAARLLYTSKRNFRQTQRSPCIGVIVDTQSRARIGGIECCRGRVAAGSNGPLLLEAEHSHAETLLLLLDVFQLNRKGAHQLFQPIRAILSLALVCAKGSSAGH
jgi:hypothetical protein